MDIRLLGTIEVYEGEDRIALGGPSQRRVFAYLAAHLGDTVTLDRLVDITWQGDKVPKRAAHNMQSYVHRLRSSLGVLGEHIETIGAGYRMDLPPESIDVRRFDGDLDLAGRALTSGDPVAALDAAQRANELWRGEPFGEFADEAWAAAERSRLLERRTKLDEILATGLLALDRAPDAVAAVQPAIDREPLSEGPRAVLMRALYESGRQAEALRAFQSFRRLLGDEIGLAPSPALQELDQRIAAGELERSAVRPEISTAYEVGELIGEGAFARVYRARQLALDRDVAIKIIRAELANRPAFIARFEAEAQMVARIEHPNVVALHDYWREPDRALLVMRWMPGGNLEQRLDAGPLPLDDVVAVIRDVAAGLDAAHRRGIVHRDVKPENIFLDADASAVLGDFGIALETAEFDQPEAALSEGSPIYAAPEQLRREPSSIEADVFALGIVAFVCLTGGPPFADAAGPVERLRRQYEDDLPTLRSQGVSVPRAVDDVIGRATSKEPTDRYRSAGQFAAELEQAATGRSVTRSDHEQRNPYKGLRPFEESDAADFFGRERLAEQLQRRLEDGERLLALVGPSGSGKSSVVHAGLVPKLRRSPRTLITSMVPGQDPFESLETALLRVAVNPPVSLLAQLEDGPRGIVRGVGRVVPGDGTRIILIIDQFEELYTELSDEIRRDQFLDGLARAVREPTVPVQIVVTLRADFYDEPLNHPTLAPLLTSQTVPVPPLAPDELEHAIVGPAGAVGTTFEPGLVTRITAEVAMEPGALPVLQHALTRAFERGDGQVITLADFEEVGGVAGALSRHAESTWLESSAAERRAMRRLFARLVVPGDESEHTRRRALLTEAAADDTTRVVVDRLTSARLVTLDRHPASREPTIEIAHEALLRHWPRLRTWIEEDREQIQLHRHLADAAFDWDRRGRDNTELYRGARLESADGLIASDIVALSPVEQAFVAASLQRAKDVTAGEVRRRKRLRTLAITASAVAVFAVLASLVAFTQQRRAEAAERRADVDRMVAIARNADPNDPTTALLLAVEAHRLAPSPDTLDALSHALTADPEFLGVLETPASPAVLADLGSGAIAAVDERAVTVWDVVERDRVAAWDLPDPGPTPFEVDADSAADGSLLAVVVPTSTTVFDRDGNLVWSASSDVPSTKVAFSPDGSRVAVGHGDGSILVHEIRADGDPLRLQISAPVSALAWSTTDVLVAGGTDGSVVAFESLGRERWAIESASAPSIDSAVLGFLFSTDGATVLVSGNADLDDPSSGPFVRRRELARVDLGNGEVLQRWDTEPFLYLVLQWLDEGRDSIVASTPFGQYAVINLVESTETPLTTGAEGGGLVALEELDLFLTTNRAGIELRSADRRSAMSQLVPLAEEQSAALPFSPGLLGAFDVEGRRFASTVLFGALPVVVDRGDPSVPLPPITVEGLPATVVDGAGAIVLVVSRLPEAPLRYQLRSGLAGDVLGPVIEIDFAPSAVEFSTTGTRLVLVDADGVGHLFDVARGVEIARLPPPPQMASGVATPVARLAPDDSIVAMVNSVGSTIYDANDGRSILSTTDHGYLTPLTGDLLLDPDNRGNADVLDLDTLEPVGPPIVGHSSRIVDFYPDPTGRFVATWARDDTTRVFDVATRRQIGPPLERSVGFGPVWNADGTELAVPTTEGFRIWNFDTDAWSDLACRIAGRNMTASEWESFGPRTIDYRATCPEFPADPSVGG